MHYYGKHVWFTRLLPACVCPSQNKPCDEPPLEVVPGRADLTHGYTRRKCVFRVVCSQAGEYLMQSEDSQAMLHWVTAIHRSGHTGPWQYMYMRTGPHWAMTVQRSSHTGPPQARPHWATVYTYCNTGWTAAAELPHVHIDM